MFDWKIFRGFWTSCLWPVLSWHLLNMCLNRLCMYKTIDVQTVLEFWFFADRLPSSAERMEKLNAGRLFEKFGKIIIFITLIQNHYWQQTHFDGNWVGGQKMLGFGRQNLEKPLFLGEAIPQAITSGLYLYNHHDLQVRRSWTFTY